MPDLKVSSDYRDEDLVITNLFFDERRPIAKPEDSDTRGMRPPIEAVGVYMAMKSMSAQAGGKSIKASQSRLGKKIGRGRDYVNRWLQVLVVLNWVKVLQEGAADGETNEYLVTKPVWFRTGDDPFAPQPIVMGVVRSDRGVSLVQTGGVVTKDTGGVVSSDTKEIRPLKTLKDSADAATQAAPEIIAHQDAIDDFGAFRSKSYRFKNAKPYKPQGPDLAALKVHRNGPGASTREEWGRAARLYFAADDFKASVNHFSLKFFCENFSAYDRPAPAPRSAAAPQVDPSTVPRPVSAAELKMIDESAFKKDYDRLKVERPAAALVAEDPASIREAVALSLGSAPASKLGGTNGHA